MNIQIETQNDQQNNQQETSQQNKNETKPQIIQLTMDDRKKYKKLLDNVLIEYKLTRRNLEGKLRVIKQTQQTKIIKQKLDRLNIQENKMRKMLFEQFIKSKINAENNSVKEI